MTTLKVESSSEKDAGFCSGEETDVDSASEAGSSSDSGCRHPRRRNKRKCVEPKKVSEIESRHILEISSAKKHTESVSAHEIHNTDAIPYKKSKYTEQPTPKLEPDPVIYGKSTENTESLTHRLPRMENIPFIKSQFTEQLLTPKVEYLRDENIEGDYSSVIKSPSPFRPWNNHDVTNTVQPILHVNHDIVTRVQPLLQGNHNFATRVQPLLLGNHEVTTVVQPLLQGNHDLPIRVQPLLQDNHNFPNRVQPLLQGNHDLPIRVQPLLQDNHNFPNRVQPLLQGNHDLPIRVKPLLQGNYEVTTVVQPLSIEGQDEPLALVVKKPAENPPQSPSKTTSETPTTCITSTRQNTPFKLHYTSPQTQMISTSVIPKSLTKTSNGIECSPTKFNKLHKAADERKSSKTVPPPPSSSSSSSNSQHNNSNSNHPQKNYKNMTRERRIEANARERTRVHTISAAFDTLRKTIPAYSSDQKLSKLSVLRIACSYIQTLAKVAQGDDSHSDDVSLPECIENLQNTIQHEGKVKKKREDDKEN